MATTKKINNKPMNIDYDEVADVLYISFGKPTRAICAEDSNGNLIRMDVYTNKIVGITIIDFKKRYMESSLIDVVEMANKIVPRILTQFKH
jgi:uncharacterized protein YuzE